VRSHLGHQIAGHEDLQGGGPVLTGRVQLGCLLVEPGRTFQELGGVQMQLWHGQGLRRIRTAG